MAKSKKANTDATNDRMAVQTDPHGPKLDAAGMAEPARPREGSKGALLVTMLSRPDGANIAELMAATGWLPHTTRAALTGLRKRGFEVVREAGEGGSRYRVAQPEPEPARPARRSRKPRGAELQPTA